MGEITQDQACDLKDKVVVVTGGSRGIGRHIVEVAIRAGARVAYCARNVERRQTVVADEAQSEILAVAVDVAKEKDIAAFFVRIIETFGRVDVLINNAAINLGDLLVSVPAERWDRTIATNLTGPFLMAQHAVGCFLEQGVGGHIVSVGSIAQNGMPNNASYATSKAGLLGLTRTITREHARDGIYANLIVTGYVRTDMSDKMPEYAKQALIDACPQRRVADPEEVARAALFLATSRSRGINGQALYVSGGLVETPF